MLGISQRSRGRIAELRASPSLLQTAFMQPVKKKLGKRIASLRRAAGLTQEKLAEKSGYSVDFIGLVERGINAPTVDGLAQVAAVLHVDIAELFADSAAENESPSRKAKQASSRKSRLRR